MDVSCFGPTLLIETWTFVTIVTSGLPFDPLPCYLVADVACLRDSLLDGCAVWHFFFVCVSSFLVVWDDLLAMGTNLYFPRLFLS
jgi:hypothetical protein